MARVHIAKSNQDPIWRKINKVKELKNARSNYKASGEVHNHLSEIK